MERWVTIRCADFQSVEEVVGSGAGEQVTKIYTEDGDEFMELPGHALTEELVERATLEVVRGETRGEEAGRAAAQEYLRQALGCASASELEALREDVGL